MATFTLKPEPDGLGYHYGSFTDDAGNVTRVDILPPASEWRGNMKPAQHLDPTQWIVYADGEEIARVARREEIAVILPQRLAPPA